MSASRIAVARFEIRGSEVERWSADGQREGLAYHLSLFTHLGKRTAKGGISKGDVQCMFTLNIQITH